jgi:hypothetical protein
MTDVCSELLRRFPELRNRMSEFDQASPHLAMNALASWLQELGDGLAPSIAEQVIEFSQWCETQPRGTDASDDAYTILVVGLYEPLFESQATRRLVRRLLSKADLLNDPSYWRQWVGSENYEKALLEYDLGA